MEIQFLKMQGCGDDTILIDCFKQPKPPETDLGRLARKILDRMRGVGGRSVLLMEAGSRRRLSARSFSPLGEEAPVSCNALRCLARYASDSGAEVSQEFSVEVGGGEIGTRIIDSLNVQVDMGMPLAGEGSAEIHEKPLESFTRSIVVDGKGITYTPVSLDSSFGIVFVQGFDFSLPRLARRLVGHPEFPPDTSVGFVRVFNREEIRLRVWKPLEEGDGTKNPRGGESPASCPGAASAVVASVVSGFADREVFVHLNGGDVFVQWQESSNRLFLTGPASYVFTGVYYFEEESADARIHG
jgi:diaminopimelate epimerase